MRVVSICMDMRRRWVLKTEGDIELIGPSVIVMKNGFAGTYVRSIGKAGSGRLMIQDGHGEAVVEFSVEV